MVKIIKDDDEGDHGGKNDDIMIVITKMKMMLKAIFCNTTSLEISEPWAAVPERSCREIFRDV